METLFLLVLSTMYPYWTWAGPQSSLTSPRDVSSCVRWPCPLKSSRLTLTCCPVCASNNQGCDREPQRTRCRPLSLFSVEERMCRVDCVEADTIHEWLCSATAEYHCNDKLYAHNKRLQSCRYYVRKYFEQQRLTGFIVYADITETVRRYAGISN